MYTCMYICVDTVAFFGIWDHNVYVGALYRLSLYQPLEQPQAYLITPLDLVADTVNMYIYVEITLCVYIYQVRIWPLFLNCKLWVVVF